MSRVGTAFFFEKEKGRCPTEGWPRASRSEARTPKRKKVKSGLCFHRVETKNV